MSDSTRCIIGHEQFRFECPGCTTALRNLLELWGK